MEFQYCFVFLIGGVILGGLGVWLLYRQSTENAVQKAIANHETHRAQLSAQLSLVQQRNFELATELTRKDERIYELMAEQGLQLARCTVLETQASRSADLEESLAEVESKLEESYRRPERVCRQ